MEKQGGCGIIYPSLRGGFFIPKNISETGKTKGRKRG
jgi:hypothetical protein